MSRSCPRRTDRKRQARAIQPRSPDLRRVAAGSGTAERGEGPRPRGARRAGSPSWSLSRTAPDGASPDVVFLFPLFLDRRGQERWTEARLIKYTPPRPRP